MMNVFVSGKTEKEKENKLNKECFGQYLLTELGWARRENVWLEGCVL